MSSTDLVLGLDYGYGGTANNGNIISQTIRIAATQISQSYTYDALNRLRTATEAVAWSQTYEYDRYGNRAVGGGYVADVALTPQSLTAFDANTNRLMRSLYDESGNQVQDQAARRFGYDAENRQVSFNSGAATYSYDADGRRVKKVDGTGTTIFVYNAVGQLIAEYSTAAPQGSGGTSYLTSDHLGSTRVVTDQSGNVKAQHDYLPFGEEIPANIGGRSLIAGYAANDSTRQRFTSKERDTESRLDYFGARYYSSAQGRFTSPDKPLIGQNEEDPQTWNLYAYTSNNPLNRYDPDGERWFYKQDDKGRILEAQWVNPNDDGTYTSPGEGWIEFVPTKEVPSLLVYTEGGNVANFLGETAEGGPRVHSISTGRVEDASMDIVGLFIPGRLGLKGLIAGASALWAKHLAKRGTASTIDDILKGVVKGKASK